jgi:hypothetical protein
VPVGRRRRRCRATAPDGFLGWTYRWTVDDREAFPRSDAGEVRAFGDLGCCVWWAGSRPDPTGAASAHLLRLGIGRCGVKIEGIPATRAAPALPRRPSHPAPALRGPSHKSTRRPLPRPAPQALTGLQAPTARRARTPTRRSGSTRRAAPDSEPPCSLWRPGSRNASRHVRRFARAIAPTAGTPHQPQRDDLPGVAASRGTWIALSPGRGCAGPRPTIRACHHRAARHPPSQPPNTPRVPGGPGA